MSALAKLTAHLPGVTVAVVIAVGATLVGKAFPLVGGPVTGIVAGVVIAALVKPGPRFQPGIKTAGKFILQVSVVILGTQLSLLQVIRVGVSSLPVMLGTLLVCLVATYLIGRWLGIVGDLRTLIGVGTGICGASAIAAVTPVIGAAEVAVTYAISTIFLFNIAAVLAFPMIGHALGMGQHSFGLFAGTAVNDMSSVVAASTTYGSAAANYAVVVKLTRTLLIIPICLGLAAITGRKARTDATATEQPAKSRVQIHRLVPWFLIGFLILAAANTVGLVPASTHRGLAEASVFLITVALSAIGLSTDLPGLRRTGHRPLILGAALWVIVTLTSLGLQAVSGML
ncbi:putative sulfate exporter family transporter [Rhodococcus sp. D2-41]|uniref:YeiH family protein n=1 Tax=Speluncibacter jeojiensis TaxID=2710754 RepID=UPI00240FE1C3|nr:putative sulfate exporter family transporter [Rhodococcus sp. D2-41]MDG3010163.1 putative sulfate exporter family transporter [Rhodococcus sp. D2-41]